VNKLRNILPLFAPIILATCLWGCSDSSAAVLEKCKAETKVAVCQTCCESEGWEKGSTASGDCECSQQKGMGL
jgi:hypothetical protein